MTLLDGTEVRPLDRARAERCQVILEPGAVPRNLRIDHARSVWPVDRDTRTDNELEALWRARFDDGRQRVALIVWVCHHGLETSLWRTDPRRGGRHYIVLTRELISTETLAILHDPDSEGATP